MQRPTMLVSARTRTDSCLVMAFFLLSCIPAANGFAPVTHVHSPPTTTTTFKTKSNTLRITSRQSRLILKQSDVVLPIASNNNPLNMTSSTLLVEPLIVLSPPTEAIVEPQLETRTKEEQQSQQPQERWLTSIDGIVFVSYLCNVMALSMPVLLVPLAVAETLPAATTTSLHHIAAAVAGVSSIATLGGAVGKFVNGFICQAFGSYTCSTVYFAGLAVCSFLFSFASSPTTMGLSYAGMEFFASIQWAALAVMLTNYYKSAPVKLAAALTALGLSSTSGQIMAKTVGMTLASSFHWRTVAQVGALTATVGSFLMAQAPKPPQQQANNSSISAETSKTSFQWSNVSDSLKAVLGSRLFWMLAVAHAMAFVARGTDRILGTFFQHTAGTLQLPGAVAGGLTLSVTLGLVHGLVTGQKKFVAAETVSGRKQFLKKRYITSIAATLGMVTMAQWGSLLVPSPVVRTAVIALLSGTMASNIAFQYFQFPAKIAKSKFGDHQPVVISFLDGFGFLFSAPIFALCGRLVPTLGWSSAWAMLAGLFGSAALLMMRAIGPVLEAEKQLEAAAKQE